jgi:ribosomal protein L27
VTEDLDKGRSSSRTWSGCIMSGEAWTRTRGRRLERTVWLGEGRDHAICGAVPGGVPGP